jgi:hypothetical protein
MIPFPKTLKDFTLPPTDGVWFKSSNKNYYNLTQQITWSSIREDGELHNTSYPARIIFHVLNAETHNPFIQSIEHHWYNDGKLHRIDGPARVIQKHNGSVIEEFAINGRLYNALTFSTEVISLLLNINYETAFELKKLIKKLDI